MRLWQLWIMLASWGVGMLDDKFQLLLGEVKNQKKIREELKHSNSEGDRLFYCLCYSQPKNKEGWFALKTKVSAFLKSDNPESEKQKLMQYTEMLAMITSGYESMED